MKIRLWIQNADYSSTDFGPVTLERATNALQSFPWNDKLSEFERMVGAGQDCCPPGLGVHRADLPGMFCVLSASIECRESVNVHIVCPADATPGKFNMSSPYVQLDGSVAAADAVIPLLGHYFKGDWEGLLTEARRALKSQHPLT